MSSPAETETEVRSRRTSLFSRYALSLGGRVVGAILQALVLAFLARSLGVDHFGVVAVTISIAQFGFAVFELGFTTRVLRLRNDSAAPAILGALLVVRAIATVVLLLGAAAGVLLSHDPLDKLLIGATIVYTIGEGLGDLAIALFQGELRSGVAVTVLIVRRSLAVLPYALGLSPTMAIAGLLLAGVGGNLAFWPAVIRRAGRPMRATEILRVNGPLTIATLAFNVQQTDSAVIGLVSRSSLTSLYGAAARLANPVMLTISTFIQVIIPEFGRLDPGPRFQALRRARKLVLLLACAVALSSLLSPFIVQVLYGPAFAAAAPIVSAVFIGAGISAIAQIHIAWLYVEGLQLRWSLVIFGAVMVGLIALALLAIAFGIVGSAIGYVTMQATIFASIFAAFLSQSKSIRHEVRGRVAGQ